MSALQNETVTHVHHWNDTLFSFKTTRSAGLRFKPGHFTMIGLEPEGKRVMRAYSIASANYDDELEFFSIKVPDGPLTSHLQKLEVGDKVLVRHKPVGTLITDSLKQGKNLYLLSTGTGLAPFLSIVRDYELYDKFDKIILTHGVRYKSELAYQDLFLNELPNNEYFGDAVREKFIYYPTVTREAFQNQGRLTDLITSGKLMQDVGLPPLNKEDDRFMLCGSPAMLEDLTNMLDNMGFTESRSNRPAEYVIENAFVER